MIYQLRKLYSYRIFLSVEIFLLCFVISVGISSHSYAKILDDYIPILISAEKSNDFNQLLSHYSGYNSRSYIHVNQYVIDNRARLDLPYITRNAHIRIFVDIARSEKVDALIHQLLDEAQRRNAASIAVFFMFPSAADFHVSDYLKQRWLGAYAVNNMARSKMSAMIRDSMRNGLPLSKVVESVHGDFLLPDPSHLADNLCFLSDCQLDNNENKTNNLSPLEQEYDKGYQPDDSEIQSESPTILPPAAKKTEANPSQKGNMPICDKIDLTSRTDKRLRAQILTIVNHCMTDKVVVIKTDNMAFDVRIAASAQKSVPVYLHSATDAVMIRGSGIAQRVESGLHDDDFSGLYRVSLSWSGLSQLDLHVLEGRALPGGSGDISRQTGYCETRNEMALRDFLCLGHDQKVQVYSSYAKQGAYARIRIQVSRPGSDCQVVLPYGLAATDRGAYLGMFKGDAQCADAALFANDVIEGLR